MAVTKKMSKNLAFVEELISKGVLEKFPNITDWGMFHKESLEWVEDGFEWKLETHKAGRVEYRIWCSNWKSIISQKMTKTEKRKKTICKQCTIRPKKDCDGIKGDIFVGDYVYTYIQIT
jgi:hypothetical protein